MAKAMVEMTLEEDTQKGKYLTFLLGEESYGIGIEHVTEIIGLLPITVVPEVPAYIRGIMNLRGRIIPVMDMRLRFKKPFVEYDERTCIIVVEIGENSVGLIVDRVSEVTNISDDNIVEQPMLSSGASNRYIRSIGKVGGEVKMLLDCDQLLSHHEAELISNIG